MIGLMASGWAETLQPQHDQKLQKHRLQALIVQLVMIIGVGKMRGNELGLLQYALQSTYSTD